MPPTAAKGPAYDLALGEFGFKDGTHAAAAKVQRRLHGQHLGHRGVVADDHAAAAFLALKQQVSVLDLPTPHELGEGPQDAHDHGDDAADERRELGIGGVVVILGRLLKQAHELPPLVDEALDYRDDSSMVWAVESTCTASSAGTSGATSRLLSSLSRCLRASSVSSTSASSCSEVSGLGIVLVALQHAAAGTLARVGGQKDLDLCVGEHDGADVATLGHDIAILGGAALMDEHGGAHAG